MSRSVGLSVLHSNFETRVAAPLDSRMLVDALADLHATATWQSGDGSYYAYKGMLVCVCNDTEENNGVYRLAALPYTNSSNWVKLGSGTGTGFTWYPDDTPPAVPEIGDAYHSSTAGASLVWDGTEWQTVAADGQDGNDGVAGSDGTSSYTYWAYASDGSGTGFSLTTTPEDTLYWVAQITVSAPLTPPTASDFSAATWVKYRYTPDEFIEILSAAPSDPAAADIGRVFLFAGATTESFTANHLYRAVSAGGAGGYLVSGAGKTEVNGVYTDSGLTWNGQPVYTFVNGETTYYLYYQVDDDPEYAWVIYSAKQNSAGGDFAAYYQCKSAIDGTWSNSEAFSPGASPAPTVSAYSPYAWEDVTAAFVRSALGVDTENGDVTKYLNEQGTFAAASGGGGGLTADETLLMILAFS